MFFKITLVCRSAYTELLVVGSRWRRIYAKNLTQELERCTQKQKQRSPEILPETLKFKSLSATPSQVNVTSSSKLASTSSSSSASLEELSPELLSPTMLTTNMSASPYITIIPTLHVANVKFYDRVLEYVQLATKRNENCIVLLEGICDSPEAANEQMNEYEQIATDAKLREVIATSADSNTLFSREVVQEMCRELKVNYSALSRLEETIRLQECYLKPKMAALCASHLTNKGDLTLKDIKQLLENETSQEASKNFSNPSTIELSVLGTFPLIRKQRERKVAHLAREYCKKWLSMNIEGEVIVPWGYFHTDAIMHYILEENKLTESSSNSNSSQESKETSNRLARETEQNTPLESLSKTEDSTENTQIHKIDNSNRELSTSDTKNITSREPGKENIIIFVESDTLVDKVSFGVTKEIFEVDESKTESEKEIVSEDLLSVTRNSNTTENEKHEEYRESFSQTSRAQQIHVHNSLVK